MRRTSLAGVALLVVAAVGGGVTAYAQSVGTQNPATFSGDDTLNALWSKYTTQYIEAGSGRVLDRSQNNLTTSEGQSYAMLRAVWEDDETTFDKVWTFTHKDLARPTDHLFAWKFGQRRDGSYGILTDQGGANTASDADTDIAYSLVMAYGRWQKSSYLTEAKAIISDIWSQEVVSVAGKPVLTADDLEKDSPQVVVNPSYFSPYAYRAFAKIDTHHDWTGLLASSYSLLGQAISQPLDKGVSAGLVPDWLRLDRKTGAKLPLEGSLDTNYGYDAIRSAWRLALDSEWNHDARDTTLLNNLGFLGEQWREHGSLAATYAHDGSNPAGYESASMYGTAIGYFLIADPQQAKAVYTSKLSSLYDPDTQDFRHPLGYYDANWVWFGIALYQHALPDLARSVTG